MAQGPNYRLQFRRRREGKTDYRRRKSLLVSGKPRAVVRRSIKYVTVQFMTAGPVGDKVTISSSSRELKEHGWKGSGGNTAASYLTGYLAGKKALGKGISEAVLDIGLAAPVKGGVLFAALKGLVDAGVEVPHDPESLPSDERVKAAGKGDIAKMLDEVKKKLEGVGK